MIREAKNAVDGRIVLCIYNKERPYAFAFDDIEDAKKVLKIVSIVSDKPIKDHREDYWTVGSGIMDQVANLIKFPL